MNPRLDGTPAFAPPHAARDTPFLEQVVDVLELQLRRFGKEAVHDGDPGEAKDREYYECVPLEDGVREEEGKGGKGVARFKLTLILSIAIGVICTTVNTHIQLTNPPSACPLDRILVVVTSLG